MNKPFNIIKQAFLLCILVFSLSCKKYLDIPLPTNSLTTSTAFQAKGTIDPLMASLYQSFALSMVADGAFQFSSETYADNVYNPTGITPSMTAQPTAITGGIINWAYAYKAIYLANMMLEGLPGSTAPTLTAANKKEYIAAAKTIRANTYFHLVRNFGDVPLVTSTNTEVEKVKGRSPKADIYALIEKDLKEAIADLPTTLGTKYFINNKYIPEAILADVYLNLGKWAEAEAMATDIINSNKFQLVGLADIFLQTSPETIMALGYANETNATLSPKVHESAWRFRPETNTPSYEASWPALSPSLLSIFESGDLRKTTWVVLRNNANYPDPNSRYFNNKYVYSVYSAVPPTGKEEDNKFYRLAELHLIRAEARAQQDKLTEAAADLNIIRTRAGLAATSAATKTALVDAVIKERRVELFSEKGVRWYDLVRTGKADAVLSAIPYKSANWKPYMVLFAIPLTEINNNPNLTQNPGY